MRLMGESFQRGLQMKNEITKHVEYLFALALKKCGDVNDAEDLTQETLLAAFQYINRGGNISNMKYWLTSVLSNKWNDALRKKYQLSLVSVDVITDIEDYNDEIEVDRPTTEQVRREVSYLAKLQREVIVKHYLEGKKVQDIARELRIPKGTVLSRLSSGRDQMRKGFESMEQYPHRSGDCRSHEDRGFLRTQIPCGNGGKGYGFLRKRRTLHAEDPADESGG